MNTLNYDISIVIVTRNRRDDVLRAVQSVVEQKDVRCETIVFVDASEDDTAEVIRERFPQIKLVESPSRQGYIRHRNQGFVFACSPVVVSLDDDAYMTDPYTLHRILEIFKQYPQAAGLALPYEEPHQNHQGTGMPWLPLGTPLRNYVGCAHAVVVRDALQVGGYPEVLVHQGEERHLCIRLWEQGKTVLFADTMPIVHTVSPRRENSRLLYYGYRNTMLFYWLRAPIPELFSGILIDAMKLLLHRMSLRTFPAKVFAVLIGMLGGIFFLKHRNSVSKDTWRRFRNMERHGPLDPNQIPRFISIRKDTQAGFNDVCN